MKFLFKELTVCVHIKYARSIVILITDTEKELASFRELSENRLQEVEQLKLKLNDTEKELASFRELSENRLNDVTSLFRKKHDCTCIYKIFLGPVNELSEKLETQQKINRAKRLENEELRINIKEKDEKIAGIIRMMSALIIHSNSH